MFNFEFQLTETEISGLRDCYDLLKEEDGLISMLEVAKTMKS